MISNYQRLINKHVHTVNPALVEAWLRFQHSTLDHLPLEAFIKAAYYVEANPEKYMCLIVDNDPDYKLWENSKFKQFYLPPDQPLAKEILEAQNPVQPIAKDIAKKAGKEFMRMFNIEEKPNA